MVDYADAGVDDGITAIDEAIAVLGGSVGPAGEIPAGWADDQSYEELGREDLEELYRFLDGDVEPPPERVARYREERHGPPLMRWDEVDGVLDVGSWAMDRVAQQIGKYFPSIIDSAEAELPFGMDREDVEDISYGHYYTLLDRVAQDETHRWHWWATERIESLEAPEGYEGPEEWAEIGRPQPTPEEPERSYLQRLGRAGGPSLGLLSAAVGGGAVGIGVVLGLLDKDKDGLSNAEEVVLGTAYDDDDTSGDGVGDELAVQIGLDPGEAHPPIGELAADLEGDLSLTEKKWLAYVAANPHGISPQILEQKYQQDGQVTPAELQQSYDRDADGLIAALDPDDNDRDIDGDLLLDGWERHGGVVINGNEQPLPGADVDNMDVYVHIMPFEGDFSSDMGPAVNSSHYDPANLSVGGNVERLERMHATAAVSRSGGDGIDLHTSFESDDLGMISPEDDGIGADHPLWGTRVFLALVEQPLLSDAGLRGGLYTGGSTAFVSADGEYVMEDVVGVDDGGWVYHPSWMADHELMHVYAGKKLSPEIAEQGDPAHPRDEVGDLSLENDRVVEVELEDGLEGLPIESAPDDWGKAAWSMRYSDGDLQRHADRLGDAGIGSDEPVRPPVRLESFWSALIG